MAAFNRPVMAAFNAAHRAAQKRMESYVPRTRLKMEEETAVIDEARRCGWHKKVVVQGDGTTKSSGPMTLGQGL